MKFNSVQIYHFVARLVAICALVSEICTYILSYIISWILLCPFEISQWLAAKLGVQALAGSGCQTSAENLKKRIITF